MPPSYELDVCTQTDVGCHREINEDDIRYVAPSAPDRGALMLVADGMGGHAAGEVASRMAVEIIARVYSTSDRDDPHAALRDALHVANRSIYEVAARDQRYKGMGTTCTALVLRDDQVYCAHVGDSRLYLIRDDGIYVLSEDHSLVMEMVKQGMITREEARHHDDKNVILRALGLHPKVDVDTWSDPMPVRAGDRFLVCSDGLYDLVGDEKIKEIVLENSTHDATTRLIALARDRGGYDNISVGLLHLKPMAEEQEQRPMRDTREVVAG